MHQQRSIMMMLSPPWKDLNEKNNSAEHVTTHIPEYGCDSEKKN